MMTGNKGEWSEIYALLKVISEKRLYVGDANLDKIETLFYPIIKVLRDESNGTFEFLYDCDLVVIKNNNEEFRQPISEFKRYACYLLKELKENKTEATFSVPEIETFVRSFSCGTLKAKSTVKSDIRIVVHDLKTGLMPELGFSIKSQLGGASSLLNAGRTTNFIYKISGRPLSIEQVEEINNIHSSKKVRERLQKIKEQRKTLKFHRTENSIFENNLVLIDSALPEILSELLLFYYSTNKSKVSDLHDLLAQKNPLKYNLTNQHPFYSYKIKRFLTDVALGMMPSKVWTGTLDVTGGYLVVKDDGDVLCYHIYNRNEFENYLYKNTKLETASTDRHQFGEVYRDNDEWFLKLNLQIRFIR